ncbi:MAG: hypothetical protein IKP20_04275 [Candidatus Methanomethylophilaceae archaeon]|nr:hypothetical protein [Candidatus Methanomethylophilaceae archaeon]
MEDELRAPSADEENSPSEEKDAAPPKKAAKKSVKKAARKVRPKKVSEDKILCDELLCSSSPEDHSKAYEIASKHLGTQWGKYYAFRMEYLGIGTERNTKKAMKTLHTGTPLLRRQGRSPILFSINPAIFDYSKIVICGSPEELRVLYCVCFEYSVRPDYYKTDPGAKVLDIMGEECPNNKESKCYIMFDSAKRKYTKSTKCFYYHPSTEDYIPDESSLLLLDSRLATKDPTVRAEGKIKENLEKILAAKGCSGRKCEVVVLNPEIHSRQMQVSDFDGPVFLDQRPFNEAGLYVSTHRKRVDAVGSLELIDIMYRLGRALYQKLRALGGRAIMCSFPHMGDNFRWLCRYDGLDYSDVTFVVAESSAMLPKLLGVKGTVISLKDSRCLRMYNSMLAEPDDSLLVVPFRPLYPAAAYFYDYQTNLATGISKRLHEPGLIGFETENGELPKRSRFRNCHKILLNPYGNSVMHRSAVERDRDDRIMRALARLLLKEGFEVYTNAPFPDQKLLLHTKRYSASVEQMVHGIFEFDLVVTVFTGFMEALIPTGCNLVVLGYSNGDTRGSMASRFGSGSYWEFNVLEDKPIRIVMKVLKIAREVSGNPSEDTPMPTNLMTLKERAQALSGLEIKESLLDIVVNSVCKGEVEDAMKEGSDDPLECCVIARFLESRGEGTDVTDAVSWYGKAAGAGVAWASERASTLAADPNESKAAIRKAKENKDS